MIPPIDPPSPPSPFDVDLDREFRIITIQGIRYSFDLFDAMGFAPTGRLLRIVERSDGVVTVNHEPDAA